MIHRKPLDNFIDYSEWEYEFQQRNRHPLLASEMWLRSFNTTFKKEINLPVPARIDYLFTSNAKGWIKKKTKRKIVREIKKQDFSYLVYVFKTVQKRIASLRNVKKHILRKYSKASPKDLAGMWRWFDESFVEFIPWYYVPWYVAEEEILVQKLEKALKPHRTKLLSIAPIQEILGVVTFPKKKTAFQEAEESFSDIVFIAGSQGIHAPKTQDAIRGHVAEFGFLSTFLFLDIPPKPHKEVEREVKKALKSSTGKHDNPKQENPIRKKALSILAGDKKALDIIALAQEYAWLLTSSVENSFKVCADLQPFFRRLAQEMGFRMKISLITPAEK